MNGFDVGIETRANNRIRSRYGNRGARVKPIFPLVPKIEGGASLPYLIFGLAAEVILACLAYFKNVSSSRIPKECSNPRGESSVAVVIATRNEAGVIEKTMKTLLSDVFSSLRAIVISLLRIFRKRHTWYEATRERA